MACWRNSVASTRASRGTSLESSSPSPPRRSSRYGGRCSRWTRGPPCWSESQGTARLDTGHGREHPLLLRGAPGTSTSEPSLSWPTPVRHGCPWWSCTSSSRRGSSDFLVGQERAQQLVVGPERSPTGRRRCREERIADLPDALLMGFRGVGRPRAERLGHLETVGVVHHGRPTIGDALGPQAHEYIAHKARDLLALLCLGEQPAQHLHSGDVVLAQL